jgi:hypothetical protein
VVLDDWNLGGQIERSGSAISDPSPLAARRVRGVCTENAAILNAWTEDQRYAAMAYADRSIPRPDRP